MAQNFIETKIDFIKSVKFENLKNDQKIGLLGALVLLLGTFLPVMSQPPANISLFSIDIFFAWILFLSALASGYFFLYPKVKYIIYSNLIASFAFIIALFNTWSGISKYQEYMKSIYSFSNNPSFMGAVPKSVSDFTWNINWLGWVVMIAGIAAIFYAVKSDLLAFSKEAKDKISTTSATLKDKAVEMKDKASETVQDVKDKAQDATNDAKDKAQDFKNNMEDKAQEVKNDAQDKAQDFQNEAQDKADQVKSDVKDKASEVRTDLNNQAQEIKSDIKDQANNNKTDTTVEIKTERTRY